MGRRTSGATVGLEKIGLVQANLATLTTTQTNSDMTLDPNGSGQVVINADMTITDRGDIRLSESSSNGTNYIAMQAAAAMAANYTITWPDAVAAGNGFVLSSDTSGNLSWVTSGGGIAVTDPGATATVHYPFFGTNSGSLPSTLSAANAKSNLTFVPSTGTLSSSEMRVTNSTVSNSVSTGALVVTGGLGVGGQLTALSITETSSIVFKENVNPIENALETVLKLLGVTYDRKDGSSINEVGLIAEDVYKVAPNLVSLDDQGQPYGLQYTKLSAYLIEAVKSLYSEIQNLKDQYGKSNKYSN